MFSNSNLESKTEELYEETGNNLKSDYKTEVFNKEIFDILTKLNLEKLLNDCDLNIFEKDGRYSYLYKKIKKLY